MASAASPLSELLTRITGRNLPSLQTLNPQANLELSLGLSSMERVELLSALEDRYQVDLSETEFADVATVGDLEKLIQGERSVQSTLHATGWEKDASLPSRGIAPPPHEQRAFHFPLRRTLRWPTTWLRMASHYLLGRPAMFLLAWPRVTGVENLRGVHGPLLVVSNHIDDVDIAFIQAALPARIRHKIATATGGEALEILRSPSSNRAVRFLRTYDRVRWTLAVALLNLFPLPRQAGFRKSFAYAGEAVDRGYSVLVFPEGKHTTDGKVQPFRSGVGLLAINLRIPILPMRIDGLFEIKKAGKKFAAPGKIQVRIGKPVQFGEQIAPEGIARSLQKAVEDL